jgi:hypothetical protein
VEAGRSGGSSAGGDLWGRGGAWAPPPAGISGDSGRALVRFGKTPEEDKLGGSRRQKKKDKEEINKKTKKIKQK